MSNVSEHQEYATHILIVDDSDEDVMITDSYFAESGIDYKLERLEDGEEVVPFLSQTEKIPDVVLLDVNMPCMDGLEALEAIKANERFAQLPIFMLTGSRLPTEIERAKALGANGFIVKNGNFALQKLIDYAGIAKHGEGVWVEFNQ